VNEAHQPKTNGATQPDAESPRSGATSFIRDPNERVGYGQINWLIVLDPRLSDGAKITYLVLKRHAIAHAEVWPSQSYVARVRQLDARSIQRHIAELVALRYITIEPPSPPRDPTNTYYFEPPSSVNSPTAIKLAERIPTASDLDKLLPTLEAEVQKWRGHRPETVRVPEGATTVSSTPTTTVSSTPTANSSSKGVRISKYPKGEKPRPPGETYVHPDKDSVTNDVRNSEGTEKKNWRRGSEDEQYLSGDVETVPRAKPPTDATPAFAGAGAPEPKRRRRRRADPPPPTKEMLDPQPLGPRLVLPERVPEPATDLPEGCWPPSHGAHVYFVWLAEMKQKDPRFAGGEPSEKEVAIGAKLMEKFPVDTTGDLLLRTIRVAIWDWRAIQASIEPWYTGQRPVPTLEAIYKLATQLAGAVNKGIIALPHFRCSDYVRRWIAPPETAGSDAIGERAKREGKPRSQVVLEMRDEEKRKKSGRATG